MGCRLERNTRILVTILKEDSTGRQRKKEKFYASALEGSSRATQDQVIFSPARRHGNQCLPTQWLSFMVPILISYLLRLGREKVNFQKKSILFFV